MRPLDGLPPTYPVGMDESAENVDDTGDLLSSLEVIEDQPLHARAAAYESLHDALARRLDAGPVSSVHS